MLVCQLGNSVLHLSRGRRRIHLEELAPAEFNRFNKPLSGKHVLALGIRILKDQGSATYRYVAGWCHDAPIDDKLRIWRHASKSGSADPILPIHPKRALKDVFRKIHPVALCQLIKARKTTNPDSSEVMVAPPGSQ